MVKQNFMVGLIAAMNEILCFARESLFFFKVLWKAKKWSAGAWILQKHIWKNVLENGKFERLDVSNAKFQNDHMSVFEAVERIRMPDSWGYNICFSYNFCVWIL